jgi:predicted nucleic-acid-binding protein
MVDLARDAMENFVKAQKQFLDVIADETAKATGGKRTNGAIKRMKKTELAQLAREATESFINAQKKLVDVAGRQMNANVKAAGKTLELVKPIPFLSLADLTREGVKSYVDAQKALMDVMLKHPRERAHEVKTARRGKKPVRAARKEAAAVA